MKFCIEKLTKSSGRLGQLVHSETGKKFQTPLLLQTTKGGSIPYLSREVFDYVSKETHMLQMTLSTMDAMADTLPLFNGSLGAFVGYKDYPTVLTIRDPCELMPQGWNERDVVPLYTRRGKEPLSAERYMDMVESFAPDIYQGLSDADTNVESAKKRIKKSVDRTGKFMDYCYARQATSTKLTKSTLFAPIVGGYNTYARTDSIKHTKNKGDNTHGGYALEGFHNYGLSATTLNTDHLSNIVTHCVNELEPEKPRLMPGAYTPLAILSLIRLGIDIFDSSYAYLAAANFKALTFNFDLTGCKSPSSNEEVPFLDMTDENLREDFTPLMHNCTCLACSKHTRAYIQHLYKTNELLGPILLMVHNLHHYINFFKAIQKSIEEDQLPALLELIKTQNTDKAINYRIVENTKVVPKTGIGKGFVMAAKVDATS